jgi:hypothetical protein
VAGQGLSTPLLCPALHHPAPQAAPAAARRCRLAAWTELPLSWQWQTLQSCCRRSSGEGPAAVDCLPALSWPLLSWPRLPACQPLPPHAAYCAMLLQLTSCVCLLPLRPALPLPLQRCGGSQRGRGTVRCHPAHLCSAGHRHLCRRRWASTSQPAAAGASRRSSSVALRLCSAWHLFATCKNQRPASIAVSCPTPTHPPTHPQFTLPTYNLCRL